MVVKQVTLLFHAFIFSKLSAVHMLLFKKGSFQKTFPKMIHSFLLILLVCQLKVAGFHSLEGLSQEHLSVLAE